MKKLLILFLLALSLTVHAQVNKMLGQWNTFDDKTGEMASSVQITEKNGIYSCVIINLYEKDGKGGWERVCGNNYTVNRYLDNTEAVTAALADETQKEVYEVLSPHILLV